MAVRTIKCPICRKEVRMDDPNMPFCSDRCRIIDLGNWAAEKYVISTPMNRGFGEGFDDRVGENGSIDEFEGFEGLQ